jgi:1-deoxy-D-xylulose-5-phosphate synthase
VSVEENVLAGGFGSALLELLQANDLELPVLRLGLPDRFIEHGTQKILRNKYGVDTQSIVTRVKEFVSPVSVERVPVPR